MGSRLVIHCEPRIAWQGVRAAYFVEGLERRGITVEVTNSATRIEDCPAVLLGTTRWRAVEATGNFLLVDRCSFGDTNQFVSLVWNGHGRRGEHRLPKSITAERWERYGVPLEPWRSGGRVILCGQTEPYSPHWSDIVDWYRSVKGVSHFRPHPAAPMTFARLPIANEFKDCRVAVTLNSSVAVAAVMAGIPTITMDEGSMAWDVTGHSLDDIRTPDRRPWAHALAWTQYTDDEIKEGLLWDYLL